MSIYDLAMIILFVGSILWGFWKGLAWQVASLAAIFVSYFVSMTFRGTVAQFISAEPPWNQFAAMLILFLGSALVVWSIFAVVKNRIREMNMGGFDRQAGAVVGAVQGGLLCMVVTMFAVALLGPTARNAIYASRSGGYIVRGINQVSAIVPAEIHAYIDPYIADFNRKIVDPNGNLPYVEPLFGTSNTQQVNGTGGTSVSNGGGLWPNRSIQTNSQQQPVYGQQRPTYGQQPQPRLGNGLPTSGQYSSGSYTQNPAQLPTYQSQWQTRPRTTQQPAYGTNGGYPSNANNGYQTQNGYAPQTAQPQYSAQPRTAESNYGFRTQPPAAQSNPNSGNSANTSNGWPDVNFQINSKDLLNRAIDGTRRAIENSAR